MTDEHHNPWRVLRAQRVYENRWIRVTHHDVLDPSGREGVYGIVNFANHALGILPLDDEDHTWLVGQWRFPLGRYSWEIPEGGGPEGEDPLVAAQRELKEETGLEARHWRKLLDMHLSNSVTDETATAYLATGITVGRSAPEPTEQLAVRRVPFAEALRMVLSGEITDALSVATIQHVALMRATDPKRGA